MSEIEKSFTKIENEDKTSIKQANDINISIQETKAQGGEAWEEAMQFVVEPGDKTYSFYEFEEILKSIHPRLHMKFNNVMDGFGHSIYFNIDSNMSVRIPASIGKSCSNEIPPVSQFFKYIPKQDIEIKDLRGEKSTINANIPGETRQIVGGWKPALLAIKLFMIKFNIKSNWDMGNTDIIEKV